MSRDALIVGISRYHNLPDLSAPAHDAEDIARCIENFGECRVVRLPEAIQDSKPIVSQQAGVTTQMLEAALVRLFKPSGKNIPQTAIFYFSGHGLQRNAGIQEGYLATSDTNPDTGNYGLSLYWLRRLLQESPVRQRVVILDCCNSGEFFNILEADPGPKSGTDRLFMAASREYEEAYESLTGSHSVFTQAILSGLNPYKVKGMIVNGHHLIDTVNEQLKGELQQPLFESSGTEIVLTRASGKTVNSKPAKVSAFDRIQRGLYKYCPFRGLEPFGKAHGEFFFGREELTQSLVQLAQSSRLSMVVGASGIGKTSLLQAGLMRSLAQQNPDDQTIHWDMRYVSLGQDPLKQLAEAFVDPTVTGLKRAEQIRTAESFFQNRDQGISQLVQAAVSGTQGECETGTPHILLVIDQFESLFQPGVNETQRQSVLDCLTAVTRKTHVPIHIVLGIRSQWLHNLENHPELGSLAATNCLWVSPMTYDQLKSTIVGPLEKIGLQYDANLIYTLLLDVVGAPGELPLLQLVLKTLWQYRQEQISDHLPPRLTLENYVQLGGLRQILRQHATAVVETLSAVEQPIARRILLSLGEFSEGSSPSRRQVEQEELVTKAFSPAQIIEITEKLVAARLVVSNADYDFSTLERGSHRAVPAWSRHNDDSSQPGSSLLQLFQQHTVLGTEPDKTAPYLEICHDSLLHNWKIIEEWLQQYRPFMKLQRTIEGAAMEWYQQGQPNHPDYFLGQTRLSEALRFQTERENFLSVISHHYLGACSQYARNMRRKRYLMRLLIPLSMATGMLTAYSYSQMTTPDYSMGQAPEANSLAAQQKTTPRYLKHSANTVGESRSGGLSRAPSARRGSQPNYSGFLPRGLDGAPDIQRSQSVPVGSLLADTMQSLGLEIKSWEQQLGLDRALAARATSQVKDGPQLSPLGQLNTLLTPVAQGISPTDPDVTVQIWCTQGTAEPACFAIPLSSISTPTMPSAPLPLGG